MISWQARGVELRQQGKTYPEAGAILIDEYELEGTAIKIGERLRGYIRRNGMTLISENIFGDKKEITKDDIKEYREAIKNLNNVTMKVDPKQTKVNLDIIDDKPILLAFWGDWHVGAKGVDMDLLEKDLDIIKNTDGVYAIGLGDYKDNANAFVMKQTPQEDIIPQNAQDLIVCDMMEELKGKIPVLIRGCHEDWSHKVDNKDFIQYLCQLTGATNLWHGGMITINFGSQEYKIFARHKWKNESGMNTTNSQRNILNDIGPVDIAVVGHKHFPDLQMLHRMNKEVAYMRTGSYKTYDEFGQKLGGYSGKHGVVNAILFPDTHKVLPFFHLEDGIEYLNLLRG